MHKTNNAKKIETRIRESKNPAKQNGPTNQPNQQGLPPHSHPRQKKQMKNLKSPRRRFFLKLVPPAQRLPQLGHETMYLHRNFTMPSNLLSVIIQYVKLCHMYPYKHNVVQKPAQAEYWDK